MAKTIYEKIENKALKDAEEIIKIGRERARQVEERIISQAKATIRKKLGESPRKGGGNISKQKRRSLNSRRGSRCSPPKGTNQFRLSDRFGAAQRIE